MPHINPDVLVAQLERHVEILYGIWTMLTDNEVMETIDSEAERIVAIIESVRGMEREDDSDSSYVPSEDVSVDVGFKRDRSDSDILADDDEEINGIRFKKVRIE